MIELILAMTLGAFAATALTVVMTKGIESVRAINRYERLHANAAFVSDTLFYWIKQSDKTATPSTSVLNLTLPDYSRKTIGLNGNTITFGENTDPIQNPLLTDSDITVTNMTFLSLARSIQTNYTLQAKNSKETFSASVTVALREP